jgi:hypothetical protein
MPAIHAITAALSALIILVGTAFLAGFVAAPPLAYGVLWLAAELRALRHRRKRDFLAFELDPFDGAKLDSAREAAADIIQRLSDIEAGRIYEPDHDRDESSARQCFHAFNFFEFARPVFKEQIKKHLMRSLYFCTGTGPESASSRCGQSRPGSNGRLWREGGVQIRASNCALCYASDRVR